MDASDLYDLLPANHRRRDVELGGPLKAFFEILVREGAQQVEADIDAFHDALFVETCAELLLPRIGALVGAETLRPLPPEAGVSMRAFIGNLLRYRRSKGTALTLELLARDVTNYRAKAIEYFMHLSCAQTVRAPRPDRKATLALRDPEVRARHGGAFDRNARTPDMRSIARASGRYNIPNVGVHIWRLQAIPYAPPDQTSATAEELAAVPPALPWSPHPGHFGLMPAGRAVSLFEPGRANEGASPDETQVPERLRRLSVQRRLGMHGYEPFTLFLRRANETVFKRVPPSQIAIGRLVPDGAVPIPPWTRPAAGGPIAAAVDPATGRLVIAAPGGAQQDVEEVRFAHAVGQIGPLGGGAYDRNDFEAPFEVANAALVYLVGAGAAAAGTTRFPTLAQALASWEGNGGGRSGFIVVTENAVEAGTQSELAFEMPRTSELTIVAAEWRSPPAGATDVAGFIVRRARRLMLLRPLHVKAPTQGSVKDAGRLTLDGAFAEKGVIVDSGALAAIELRHSTLWPGAPVALQLDGADAAPLALALYRTITGRVVAGPHVGTVSLKDTIVARGAVAPAADLDAPASAVVLQRVTLFGTLSAKTVEASDTLLMGAAHSAHRQSGCVRYSFIGDPDNSSLPRRYRCQPELAKQARAAALGRELTAPEAQAIALSLRPPFVDVEPGEPAYGLLAMDCPREIAFGGEGETEMGAYAFLGGAARLANLTDLFNDYVPSGLEAGALRADRSGVEAARSNLP